MAARQAPASVVEPLVSWHEAGQCKVVALPAAAFDLCAGLAGWAAWTPLQFTKKTAFAFSSRICKTAPIFGQCTVPESSQSAVRVASRVHPVALDRLLFLWQQHKQNLQASADTVHVRSRSKSNAAVVQNDAADRCNQLQRWLSILQGLASSSDCMHLQCLLDWHQYLASP